MKEVFIVKVSLREEILSLLWVVKEGCLQEVALCGSLSLRLWREYL